MLSIFFCTIGVAGFAQPVHEDERYVPEEDALVVEKIQEWQGFKFGLLKIC